MTTASWTPCPVLAAHRRLGHVSPGLTALLAGPGADDERHATVALFLAGLTGPFGVPDGQHVTDARMRDLLIDLGRRLLPVRARRQE